MTGFSHAWLNLFSARPLGSVDRLLEGVIFSAVAAWFAALCFTIIYNLVGRTDRIV